MWAKHKNQSGFTIVELLIVIVVIGILALISTIAFNGIQTRAENTKTISAATSWAKALQLYYAKEGSYPTSSSCLGSSTTYTNAYSGRCYPFEGDGWVVYPALISALSPYITNSPEPSNKNASNDSTTQYRGALYYYLSTTDARIYINILGAGASCPSISGLNPIAPLGGTALGNGTMCYYRLPQ